MGMYDREKKQDIIHLRGIMVMESELISIIVPIYNVQNYLCRCIESIQRQTYHNLEIILVDDGSTDESGAICEEAKQKDNRIIVIHQKNQGVSEARNRGIEEANGKYIGFIDGDDYIDEDMFENLYQGIIQSSADLAVCGFYIESEERREIRSCGFAEVLNRDEAFKALFSGQLADSNCNKLFKKELFRNIKYKKIFQGEDLEILYRILGNIDKVVCISAVSYHVVYRKGSASNSIFNDKRMDIIYVLEDMVSYIQTEYPVVLKEAYAYQLREMLNMIEYMYLCMKKENFTSSDEYRNYVSTMRKNRMYIYNIARANLKYYCFNPSVHIENYVFLAGLLLHIFRPVYFLYSKCKQVYKSLC